VKLLLTTHNTHSYVFQVFELTNRVEVYKDAEPAYLMTKAHAPDYAASQAEWVCDCPGFRYRGYCWHSTFLPAALGSAFPVTEPWAQWAEDAVVLMTRQQKETPNGSLQLSL
jgi:hypothetical protein